ncbi:hypothetical protein B0I35DRAFT_246329 [Stachybotrys elegans]|uniref:Uncharacterized protein n=1 Tax=Stachybotrys elegans TaxID=80388 RepID=A0A8K0SVH6_9HYPO|nr:hypothetical protein B0I35DRAFT_246329 [Stachybotrys elegans]
MSRAAMGNHGRRNQNQNENGTALALLTRYAKEANPSFLEASLSHRVLLGTVRYGWLVLLTSQHQISQARVVLGDYTVPTHPFFFPSSQLDISLPLHRAGGFWPQGCCSAIMVISPGCQARLLTHLHLKRCISASLLCPLPPGLANHGNVQSHGGHSFESLIRSWPGFAYNRDCFFESLPRPGILAHLPIHRSGWSILACVLRIH